MFKVPKNNKKETHESNSFKNILEKLNKKNKSKADRALYEFVDHGNPNVIHNTKSHSTPDLSTTLTPNLPTTLNGFSVKKLRSDPYLFDLVDFNKPPTPNSTSIYGTFAQNNKEAGLAQPQISDEPLYKAPGCN